MTRPYHSPSSLSGRCDYAWALRYIEGIREAEIPWLEIEEGRIEVVKPGKPAGPGQCTTMQRSTSCGKAMHSCLEAWYEGGTPNWRNKPGQMAVSGLHYLPQPSHCDVIEVEEELGFYPLENSRPDGPQLYLDAGGVRWAGFRDLLVHMDEAETARLGVGPWLLCDYKSTADLAEYPKTPEKLRKDVQCCLYAYAVMVKYDLAELDCRWVYFENRDKRAARPVDVHLTRFEALAVLEGQKAVADRLDSIQTLADAEKNPVACEDYGGFAGNIGCLHHHSLGGRCTVRRSFGRLIQIHTKGKDIKMAISAATQAKLDALQAKREGRTPDTTPAPAPTAEPEAVTSVEVPRPNLAPPPPAPAKPKAAPAPKPKPVPVAVVVAPTAQAAAAAIIGGALEQDDEAIQCDETGEPAYPGEPAAKEAAPVGTSADPISQAIDSLTLAEDKLAYWADEVTERKNKLAEACKKWRADNR